MYLSKFFEINPYLKSFLPKQVNNLYQPFFNDIFSLKNISAKNYFLKDDKFLQNLNKNCLETVHIILDKIIIDPNTLFLEKSSTENNLYKFLSVVKKEKDGNLYHNVLTFLKDYLEKDFFNRVIFSNNSVEEFFKNIDNTDNNNFLFVNFPYLKKDYPIDNFIKFRDLFLQNHLRKILIIDNDNPFYKYFFLSSLNRDVLKEKTFFANF